MCRVQRQLEGTPATPEGSPAFRGYACMKVLGTRVGTAMAWRVHLHLEGTPAYRMADVTHRASIISRTLRCRPHRIVHCDVRGLVHGTMLAV